MNDATLIFGVPAASVVMLLFGTVAGFLAHMLQKVAELRAEDSSVTMSGYVVRQPYRSASKLILVLGASIGMATQDVTPLLFLQSIAVGYAADSVGNRIAK